MAGLSIYSIPNWNTNINYNLWDVYKYNDKFYYTIVKHNSGTIFDASKSDGIITYNGIIMPYFFFIPSYNSEIQIEPRVKTVQFGGGYSSVSPDDINTTLLPFNLTFEKRTDSETRAILHFLNEKAGYKRFIFTPPAPFNSNKIFIASPFSHSKIFVDNNTIKATFKEVPV